MEVKHWFKVALLSHGGDGDLPYTTHGVQRVYVDDEGTKVDLLNAFVNVGVTKFTPQLKAYILKNSRPVAKEPMICDTDKVAGVMMDALAQQLIPESDLTRVHQFIMDLNNHIVPSAKSAYQASNFSIVENGDTAENGDDE